MSKPNDIIRASQIRAARGLLDWSQEDFAQLSGLSVATIRKLELGQISPRGKTNHQIRQAMEDAGLEFIEPNGVRQKPEEITIYDGPQSLISFYETVLAHATREGGEIVTVCINEDPISERLGSFSEMYLSSMAALGDAITMKCILTENNKSMPAIYCEYRSISKDYVDSVPFYIYGNNYAMFLFSKKHNPKIIIHHSKLLADAYRKQFYSMWDKATPLNKVTKPSRKNNSARPAGRQH